MVTVCPSQFATRRTLFHVLVGCGLLMLKVSRLKLPVIWLLVSMWLNTLRLLEGTLQAGTSAVSDKLLDLVGLGGKSAADKGKDTRDYLAAAFPELNAWERAGADASSAGMVDAGFENQKELTKMQLDNQKEIAEMQN